MNLLNLISDIQAADPEFADRVSPRRSAIKNITSFGSKVAVAALPFAFSTLFKKAYGQSANPSVNDVLNFALTAELTEACFYNTAVARAGEIGIPSGDLDAIKLIQADENNHVNFIKSVLTDANVSAANKARSTNAITTGTVSASFDFSGAKGAGNGPFATVFSSYPIFLATAQAFEDTGVRAYKGQAGFLKGNQVVLTAALNIHSVEARHAAYLRRLRTLRASSSVTADFRPWITGDGTTASAITVSSAATAATNPIYANDNQTSQAGVNLTSFGSAKAASEAFDEPLTSADVVNNILVNFLR
ncbi:ferritin-like domain-containing protein [Mucilaginibacter daejeonensis]|uniref:ferritin-like domain-containing protein n=1 Tax=Mucilaginibacter daejeonensis TaxID=398049 RepID=UPI001D176C87|nr:ferritin-like domain-containing protein [Mucilaginibacter daejeonensis]UEG51733.1 ferritin-like domain-containing protein [Mucilaginibacter daejeonensis]